MCTLCESPCRGVPECLFDIDALLAETRRPKAPDRCGPMIVCECFNPVAPGNPEGRLEVSPSSSLMGGLEGIASSGHLSTSAREAARMYGFEWYEGSNVTSRAPYGSSTLR